MSEIAWKHNDLQHDLADYLASTGDKVVWEDMQMGASGSARPDVYVIPKSYSKFRPITYEIKISVSDFRSDITSGKWQKYLEFSSGVLFAVPAGLISKDDIPKGCGLIVRHDSGWRVAKAPTLQVVNSLPHHCWMKLMIDGIERQNRQFKIKQFHENRALEDIKKKYGERIAGLLKDLSAAEGRISYEIERANTIFNNERERLKKEAEDFKEKFALKVEPEVKRLFDVLGLPLTASPFDVAWRCREILERLDKDSEVKRLKLQIESIERALNSANKPFPLLHIEAAA